MNYINVPSQMFQDRRMGNLEFRLYCAIYRLSGKGVSGQEAFQFDASILTEVCEMTREPQFKVWQALQNLCRYGYITNTHSIKHYRLLLEKEITGKQQAHITAFDAKTLELPWPSLKPSWDKWVDYYESRYSRIDAFQAKEIINHINLLIEQGQDATLAINSSIAAGYKQIYARKGGAYSEKSQSNHGQHRERSETPFERQKRIIQEKRARKREASR